MLTIDHFDGNEVVRPIPNAIIKYDFDFRKRGSDIWRYLNSANIIKDFDAQIEVVLNHGGEYRIVENETNIIVRMG